MCRYQGRRFAGRVADGGPESAHRPGPDGYRHAVDWTHSIGRTGSHVAVSSHQKPISHWAPGSHSARTSLGASGTPGLHPASTIVVVYPSTRASLANNWK